MLDIDDIDIGLELTDLLPRGSSRVAMAFVYIIWAVISIAIFVTGFFQDSTLLTAIHIVTGSLFLLAMLVFLCINVMTSGKPGCILLIVQNAIAAVLGLTAVVVFMFGHFLDSLLH